MLSNSYHRWHKCRKYYFSMRTRTYRDHMVQRVAIAALEYNHARYVAAILYITRNRSTQAKGAACCCVGTPHTTQRGERPRHSGAADPRLNRGCCIDSPLSLVSGCSVRTFEQSARLEILSMHGNTEKSTRLEILWMHGTEKTSTCQRRRGVQMMTRLG